jgi:hypothetical protein
VAGLPARFRMKIGNLTKSVIERMKSATSTEDLEGWVVGPDEHEALRGTLLEALSRNSEPAFVGQILWALGKAGDASLKQLYIDYPARYLSQLKKINGVVYLALIALDNIVECVFETRPDGSSSQSLTAVDENIRQAHHYLEKHQIIVPW